MKRLLPFVVLILLVFAGIFSVPFLLRPESHRAEITDKLSSLLKRPVVIGQISMTYWPPTLRLDKVAVMNEVNTPFIQVESVAAPLDWASLCHLQFLPTELQFNHAVLTANRNADGGWDIENWLSGNSGISIPGTVPLAQISWKDGEVIGMDRYAAEPQSLHLAALEGKWDRKQGILTTSGGFSGIGAPARLSVSAKGEFLSTPQWSGDLQLTDEARTASFHIEKQAGTVDIKGGAGQWKLANALAFAKFYGREAATQIDDSGARILENWQIHTHRDGDHLTMEHTAILSGGLSEIKGRIDGRLLHADVALKDVPADAVLSAFGEKIPLSGKVTGLAKEFEITLSTLALGSLKGQGYFELKEGRYLLPEVSLKKLARAKTMAYIKKKFPNLETQGIMLDQLSAHWQAKSGVVSVEDGLLASSAIKAGWVGKLDVARRGLEGYIRLQLHEKDPKLAHLIPSKYQSQPALGRLQGTWDEWTLRSVPASKIPSATQAKLRKATGR